MRKHPIAVPATMTARGPRRPSQALNDRVAADDRVVAVQLTVRDGVTLIRRKA